MIRRSLLLAALLGLGLVSLSDQAETAPVTYWCVFYCVDGTEGGGPVTPTKTESGGTLCLRFAGQQCRLHGGVSMWGLDP
jgi:hypothetical protein